MKKRVLAVILSLTVCLSALVGCGAKVDDSSTTVENNTSSEEDSQPEASSTEDDLSQLEAIGDVDVDKKLFDVTLTIPKDFVGDTTQEKLDESAKEKGYKSATLNSDGSVTFVMTKEQHKEMLSGIKETIDKSLADMIGSKDYPNITNVEANDDYTKFTITTKNAEPDLAESFAVMALYMYGGMYGIFAGEKVDNVQVDFVNADSGEIISTGNSKDMGNGN